MIAPTRPPRKVFVEMLGADASLLLTVLSYGEVPVLPVAVRDGS
jgi:hypothetical protein